MIHKITSLKKSFLITLLFSSLLSSNEVILIDVRSLEEVKTGIIESAIHIEWTEISEEINRLNLQKEQSIFLSARIVKKYIFNSLYDYFHLPILIYQLQKIAMVLHYFQH